ncbi:hypothetical protein EMIT0P218_40077 [Pseudomonas sp. IT-P218]
MKSSAAKLKQDYFTLMLPPRQTSTYVPYDPHAIGKLDTISVRS